MISGDDEFFNKMQSDYRDYCKHLAEKIIESGRTEMDGQLEYLEDPMRKAMADNLVEYMQTSARHLNYAVNVDG